MALVVPRNGTATRRLAINANYWVKESLLREARGTSFGTEPVSSFNSCIKK